MELLAFISSDIQLLESLSWFISSGAMTRSWRWSRPVASTGTPCRTRRLRSRRSSRHAAVSGGFRAEGGASLASGTGGPSLAAGRGDARWTSGGLGDGACSRAGTGSSGWSQFSQAASGQSQKPNPNPRASSPISINPGIRSTKGDLAKSNLSSLKVGIG